MTSLRRDDKGPLPGLSAHTLNIQLLTMKQFCWWIVAEGRAA